MASTPALPLPRFPHFAFCHHTQLTSHNMDTGGASSAGNEPLLRLKITEKALYLAALVAAFSVIVIYWRRFQLYKIKWPLVTTINVLEPK